jgi:hypothetical protein
LRHDGQAGQGGREKKNTADPRKQLPHGPPWRIQARQAPADHQERENDAQNAKPDKLHAQIGGRCSRRAEQVGNRCVRRMA